MARLYRPHIPLSIRVQVAERQLRQREETGPIGFPRPLRSLPLKRQLDHLLQSLSESIMCEVSDLRLDHDPPLGARDQVKTKNPRWPYAYSPDANDPEHLRYRPHGAQFEGSHDVKTRIRGDHGQFSDLTLIKRERRRQKEAKQLDPAYATGKFEDAIDRVYFMKRKPKARWPKRKFETRRKGK